MSEKNESIEALRRYEQEHGELSCREKIAFFAGWALACDAAIKLFAKKGKRT